PRLVDVVVFGAVVPRRRRHVFGPRVIWACVIGDLILDELDAEGVRRVRQLAQRRQVAEVFVHGVEIYRAIAVIAGRHLAVINFFLVGPVGVVVPGVEPQGGDAERFQVRQTGDDAAQVAAVVVATFGAVKDALRLRRVVIGGVAVAE